MPTVEPLREHQLRINDPFQQRILQFDIADSRYYLARTNNLEFDAIGKDIVLSGYRVEHTFDTTSATFTISEGWAILDSTVIYMKEPYVVNFPSLTSFDENGLLIVYLDYQWLEVYGENPILLQASHIQGSATLIPGSPQSGFFTVTSISPETWNTSKDRIILQAYQFTKDGGGFIDSLEPVNKIKYFPIVFPPSVTAAAADVNYYFKGQHIDLDDEENHIHMWELFRSFVEHEFLFIKPPNPSPLTSPEDPVNPCLGSFSHLIEDHSDVWEYDNGSSSFPGDNVDGHILQFNRNYDMGEPCDIEPVTEGFEWWTPEDIAEGTTSWPTGIRLHFLNDVDRYTNGAYPGAGGTPTGDVDYRILQYEPRSGFTRPVWVTAEQFADPTTILDGATYSDGIFLEYLSDVPVPPGGTPNPTYGYLLQTYDQSTPNHYRWRHLNAMADDATTSLSGLYLERLRDVDEYDDINTAPTDSTDGHNIGEADTFLYIDNPTTTPNPEWVTRRSLNRNLKFIDLDDVEVGDHNYSGKTGYMPHVSGGGLVLIPKTDLSDTHDHLMSQIDRDAALPNFLSGESTSYTAFQRIGNMNISDVNDVSDGARSGSNTALRWNGSNWVAGNPRTEAGNIKFTYMLHDNGIYGITTEQFVTFTSASLNCSGCSRVVCMWGCTEENDWDTRLGRHRFGVHRNAESTAHLSVFAGTGMSTTAPGGLNYTGNWSYFAYSWTSGHGTADTFTLTVDYGSGHANYNDYVRVSDLLVNIVGYY